MISIKLQSSIRGLFKVLIVHEMMNFEFRMKHKLAAKQKQRFEVNCKFGRYHSIRRSKRYASLLNMTSSPKVTNKKIATSMRM